MRLVEMSATKLQPGMFVAELDRPWLDTPFALQGFVVRDDDEVLYISKFVDNVFIDADYRGSRVFLPQCPKASNKVHSTGGHLKLKADFQLAKLSFESASKSLDKVFESIKGGQQADINTVRQSVQPLIKDVFRNKDAVAALVRLKETSNYRYNHGVSMAVWAAILGRHIGLLRDELEKLVVGCAMCDLGMTKLPDGLMDQPGDLTEEQRKIIKEHPLIGSKMVHQSDSDDIEIVAIIENHHERHDGSGYPRGVEGATIPLLARIAGLVDTYDAMITPRAYAPARSSYEAVQELIDTKGRLFQEALIEQFVQAIGLFPTGSLVELNTDEVAIVVKQNNIRRLKPEVVVVLKSDKSRQSPLKLIDLGSISLTGSDACWVARELEPGAYGVNSEEFFI